MYRSRVGFIKTTSLEINQGYQAETIEQKVDRIKNNNEPISEAAPLIYTERKDGVQPEYNIRTDKMEVALDAMIVASEKRKADRLARAEARIKKDVEAHDREQQDGQAESTQATSNNE